MSAPVLTNHSPVPLAFSWTAFNVSYDGVTYPVAAGNSANMYVSWIFGGGSPTVVGSDTQPVLSPADLLLFLNKDGVASLAPTDQMLDGSLLVTGTVTADAIHALNLTASQYIQSDNFASGVRGWHVDADGDAEFNDITARGQVEVIGAASVSANLDSTFVAVPSDAYVPGEGVTLWTFNDGTLQGWTGDSSLVGAASYPYLLPVTAGGGRSEQDGSMLAVPGTPGSSGDLYLVSPSFVVNIYAPSNYEFPVKRRTSIRIKASTFPRVVYIGYRWYTSTDGSGVPFQTVWSPAGSDATDAWGSVAFASVPPNPARSGRLVIRIVGCVANSTNWSDQHYIETAGVESPSASTVTVSAIGGTTDHQVTVTSTSTGVVSARPNAAYARATQSVIPGDSWAVGASVTRLVGAGSGARYSSVGALWSDSSGGFIGLDLLLAPAISAGQSTKIRQVLTVPTGASVLTVYVGILALTVGDAATFSDVVLFRASTITSGIIKTADAAPSIEMVGATMQIWPDPTTVTPGGIIPVSSTQGILITSAMGGAAPSSPAASIGLDTNPGGLPSFTFTGDKFVMQSSAAAAAQAIGTDLLGAWVPWGPAVPAGCGLGAGGGANGSYLIFGKSVTARYRLTAGTSGVGTSTGTNSLSFTLPLGPKLSQQVVGTWILLDNSSSQVWGGSVFVSSGAAINFIFPTNNGFGTQTFANNALIFTNNRVFSLFVNYEAA